MSDDDDDLHDLLMFSLMIMFVVFTLWMFFGE